MIYAIIAVGVVLAIVIARVTAARGRTPRNASFFASALVTRDLVPSTSLDVAVPLAAGAPHAVWLELELTSRGEIAFELALAIRIGDRAVLDGSYPVTFDDEHDARGLPNPPGISALDTAVVALPGSTRITTTLRAFRFDAPTAGPAQIRATFVPGAGVTVTRARLLVTSPDAPAGSGTLPAGMRAIG